LISKQRITQSIICNGYPINIVDVVYKEIGTKLDFPNMSITNNQLKMQIPDNFNFQR